jgi:hypothetical protein
MRWFLGVFLLACGSGSAHHEPAAAPALPPSVAHTADTRSGVEIAADTRSGVEIAADNFRAALAATEEDERARRLRDLEPFVGDGTVTLHEHCSVCDVDDDVERAYRLEGRAALEEWITSSQSLWDGGHTAAYIGEREICDRAGCCSFKPNWETLSHSGIYILQACFREESSGPILTSIEYIAG